MAYPTYIYDPYRTADPSGRPSYGYLAGLYPAAARRIQAEAKRECTRLDHPGSVLYDEYPDKESILYLTDLIFFRIAEAQLGKMAVAFLKDKPYERELVKDIIKNLTADASDY